MSSGPNGERDARRLAVLARAGAIREVYVPPEPYRTLRSLTHYPAASSGRPSRDQTLAESVTAVKNQLKALCRRHGIRCKGTSVYPSGPRALGAKGGSDGRAPFLKAAPNAPVRWQMQSLYRRLDALERERTSAGRMVSKQARKVGVVKVIETIPGIHHVTGPAIIAWLADPDRFKRRVPRQARDVVSLSNHGAKSSYAGLGLKQDVSNWKMTGHAHASKRGQRELKRALFIAARAAIKGKNALAERYQARLAAGWEDKKAIRDIARTILFIACAIWKSGEEYDDGKVSVPKTERDAQYSGQEAPP